MIEIERKFLVENPPENFKSWPAVKILQGYVAIEDNGREVRIRQKENRYFQTIKSGNGLIRSEIEIELTKEQFEFLWPATEGRRIEKTRYHLQWNYHTVELDVYSGNHEGLCIAEIEFDSEEESKAIIVPEWFGAEVTEDEQYRNRNLAQ